MNLSSLVHTSRVKQDMSSHAHSYVPQNSQPAMASSNPYSNQPISPYSYMATAPQAPPSPPVDDAPKCSLPSISSLLGITEGQTPPEQTQQPTPQQSQQHTVDAPYQRQTTQYATAPAPSVQRAVLPPTPPMHSGSEFDSHSINGRHSPSAASSYSVSSSTPGYYFAPAINNVEPHSQRQAPPQQSHSHVQQVPVRRVSMPYAQSYYGNSPQSMSSYYGGSPMQPTPPQQQISGLYYQRPLPQSFPPPLIPLSVTMQPSSGTNPWQHHHYISPSSSAAFPPSQDRYICQTCSKAFSRPSSLRIHSHSHTGEKPFKCPQRGCGKAFSVRSNMKRHERGCHSFDEVAGGVRS